ncbi:phosphatase PAP2 family protein [Amycolatopsis balhimycina DSM 5908]|uniref:Phosphatase PAP2 family protein n=1 Tax=Amycolatopsis balhimycina DSM 5908 TaxID=1081091 RepID=A0A428WHW4_AMYBA|nr:phosphatase PAP2 family protein [Amycolatopsis balhimycina]RSM42650.1 phosphatase PAP2 family protein [Amycolatopsis balhimycina DSM 5908]
MDGGAIDGGWYLDVLGFARATPWLHGFFQVFTNAGLVLLALVVAFVWWRARRRDAGRMAAVLWVPIAVGLAYGLSNLVKILVEEPRPCIRFPAVPTVATCDFATDYSFPSNHVTIAVSAAVALLLVGRRAGLASLAVAVLIGFSRVYLGAHYVHDVLAGAVLGAGVALIGLLLRAPLTALVIRLRAGRCRPLVGAAALEGKRVLGSR